MVDAARPLATVLAILARVNGQEIAATELREIEQGLALESGSLRELFQRRMLPALMIGIALPVFSQICGINVLIYYGLTVLEKTGLSKDQAMLWQAMFGVVNMLFTLVAIFTVDKFGRKPLLLTGIVGVGLGLLGGGWLFTQSSVAPASVFFVFSFFLACFAFSYAPLSGSSSPKSFPRPFAAAPCRFPFSPSGPLARSSARPFRICSTLSEAHGASGCMP